MDVDYRINIKISNSSLNDLYFSAWPNHQDMDFGSELAHAYIYITAHVGEVLIGFVKLIWDGGHHGFVLEPTVHPDYQRNGIGSELLHHLGEEARRKGLRWLHVDFEPHLENFYRKAGFTHTEAGLLDLTV